MTCSAVLTSMAALTQPGALFYNHTEGSEASPSGIGRCRFAVPWAVSQARELLVVTQVAVAFAAMHDTPARMAAVGVLKGVIPWAASRAFFATRLRRR